MRLKPYFLLAAFFLVPLFVVEAQPVVLGAGYSAPKPIDVAPGQIITIFARVPGKAASGLVAANPPLPTSLGGFSVLLRQTFGTPLAVPILSTADTQNCSAPLPLQCDTYSTITVQIPFELVPNVPHTSVPQNFARLEIGYNGSPTSVLFLNAIPDSIHVLNTCDAVSPVTVPGGCFPVITHADGSLVTRDKPAQPGETVTMTLLGMGGPAGKIATGVATPQPTTLDGVFIAFDARVNASPSMLVPTTSFPVDVARMRVGAVGIYDIPFLVPSLPPDVTACSATVESNLTVNITRTASYDGVGICVTPQN